MNFGRVLNIDDDSGDAWIEYENGNQFRIESVLLPDGLRVDELLLVTENEVVRAPSAATWRRGLSSIVELLSIEGSRAILRVGRTPNVEEVTNIQMPEVGRYYFFDGDSRTWKRLTDAESSAARAAESADEVVNRFEVEHLNNAAGGRTAYGGMAEPFDMLLGAIRHNFQSRSSGNNTYSSGAILFGPPGTGKTFMARSVAEEAGASLITVNGPELVDRWFGSTEQAMRDLFAFGRQHAKSVIFIDEFDSIGPKRGPDVHEAVNRQVGQLLALTDSANKVDRPFVIAATNRLPEIDPGFLRAGRFDYKIQFDLPSAAERLEVIRAQAPGLDMPVVDWISGSTNGWSQAQLSQIWRETDRIRRIKGSDKYSFEDLVLAHDVVRTQHVILARAMEHRKEVG